MGLVQLGRLPERNKTEAGVLHTLVPNHKMFLEGFQHGKASRISQLGPATATNKQTNKQTASGPGQEKHSISSFGWHYKLIVTDSPDDFVVVMARASAPYLMFVCSGTLFLWPRSIHPWLLTTTN